MHWIALPWTEIHITKRGKGPLIGSTSGTAFSNKLGPGLKALHALPFSDSTYERCWGDKHAELSNCPGHIFIFSIHQPNQTTKTPTKQLANQATKRPTDQPIIQPRTQLRSNATKWPGMKGHTVDDKNKTRMKTRKTRMNKNKINW